MKKIWMRVGMDVELTDEEYDELLKAAGQNGGKYDYRKLENLFEKVITKAIPSGETYILGKNCGGVDDYDNPDEEISVLL